MDDTTRTHLDNIFSDASAQDEAYTYLMSATDQPVEWAYEAWEKLLAGLKDKDNRTRAIASQVLSNLAKSDPDQRMLKDFAALLAVTKDERFVTARHCLQSLWKVGVAGDEQRQVYLDGLAQRFEECASEKNCTLIRYDIEESLGKVYDVVHDDALRDKALALIESEPDAKYRKKYATLWRKKQ